MILYQEKNTPRLTVISSKIKTIPINGFTSKLILSRQKSILKMSKLKRVKIKKDSWGGRRRKILIE